MDQTRHFQSCLTVNAHLASGKSHGTSLALDTLSMHFRPYGGTVALSPPFDHLKPF